MDFSEISLTYSPVLKAYKWTLDADGDIATEQSLDSVLLYSLFGERRANASEIPESKYRRGWIGNAYQDTENGSKLWLFEQARITRSTLNGISDAAKNALQWLTLPEFSFAESVSANTRILNNSVLLEVSIEIQNSIIEQYQYTLWQNTGTA